MKKVFKDLTEDQKSRGVVFSSELIGGGKVHEVFADEEDKEERIKRLLDDKFFNDSPYKYNLIRQ